MSITLYTTHCPRCNVLEQMLREKNIPYSICTDKSTMLNMGLTTVPHLQVDEQLFNYQQAFAWVNAYKG